MIPAANILWSIDSLANIKVVDKILVGVSCSINSCLGGLHWKRKSIHNVESVSFDFALHHTHYFNISSRLGVHDHLYKSCGRYLDLCEVILIFLPRFFSKKLINFCLVKVIKLLLIDNFILKLESLESYF